MASDEVCLCTNKGYGEPISLLTVWNFIGKAVQSVWDGTSSKPQRSCRHPCSVLMGCSSVAPTPALKLGFEPWDRGCNVYDTCFEAQRGDINAAALTLNRSGELRWMELSWVGWWKREIIGGARMRLSISPHIRQSGRSVPHTVTSPLRVASHRLSPKSHTTEGASDFVFVRRQ